MSKKRTKTLQAQNEAQQANSTRTATLDHTSLAHISNDGRDYLSGTASDANVALQPTEPDGSGTEKGDSPHPSVDTQATVMYNKSYTGIYKDAETAAYAARPDSLIYAQPQLDAGVIVPVEDADVLIYGYRTPQQRQNDKILAEIISTDWSEARAAADELLRLYQKFDMVEMYQYLERLDVSPIVVFELLMRANSAAMSETRRRAAVARHQKTLYAKKAKPHVLKQFDVYLAAIRAGAPQPNYRNKARFIDAMQREVKLLFDELPELTSKAISSWLEPRRAEFPPHWPRSRKKLPTRK